MAAKADDVAGAGAGGGDTDLTSLGKKELAATEALAGATKVRDKREATIDMLTAELAAVGTEEARRDQLKRIDKEKDLLAAALADVTEARKRCVSLRAFPFPTLFLEADPSAVLFVLSPPSVHCLHGCALRAPLCPLHDLVPPV